MNFKFEYKNDTERKSVLEENENKRLIEEQNITEGNFLIYSDDAPTITMPVSEYNDLQNQLLLSENKNIEGGIF